MKRAARYLATWFSWTSLLCLVCACASRPPKAIPESDPFAALGALVGTEFSEKDVFTRGVWRFDALWSDGGKAKWMASIHDCEGGRWFLVPLAEKGDASDLRQRITDRAGARQESSMSLTYRSCLARVREYALSDERPLPLPKNQADYRGPFPSLEAERVLRRNQGKRFQLEKGVFRNATFTIESDRGRRYANLCYSLWDSRPNPIPLNTDADVGHLYWHLTGKKHAWLGGNLSKDYQAFLQGTGSYSYMRCRLSHSRR